MFRPYRRWIQIIFFFSFLRKILLIFWNIKQIYMCVYFLYIFTICHHYIYNKAFIIPIPFIAWHDSQTKWKIVDGKRKKWGRQNEKKERKISIVFFTHTHQDERRKKKLYKFFSPKKFSPNEKFFINFLFPADVLTMFPVLPIFRNCDWME